MVNSILLVADIWFTIASFLSIKDILNLQMTCKSLQDILAEHYIWFHALKDILGAITIPDLDEHGLALMSRNELKRRAILVTRVNSAWRKPTIKPRIIREFRNTSYHIVKSKLLLGGEWLIHLLSDGSLCLQSSHSDVYSVIDSTFKTENPDVRMTLSLSAKKETLVLLRTWSWDSSAQRPSTTIAIFRVETATPRFHLLMRVIKHHDRAYENSVAAENNLWAFSWCQNSRQLLSVRNILTPTGEAEKEVILDIGEPIHATLSILSERYVLVTSCAKVSLYSIPELKPIRDGADLDPPVITVAPLWTRTYEDRYNYPPISPVHWRGANGHHEKPLALFTGSALRFFHQSQDPQSPGQCSLASYWLRSHHVETIDARPILSDRRVIWSERGKLQTCPFPLPFGGQHDAGLMRLGYSEEEEESDEMRIAPILLGEATLEGKVRDVSWDESSGRLCVLLQPQSRVKTSSRIVIMQTF